MSGSNPFGGGRGATVHPLRGSSSWINACDLDGRSQPRPTLANVVLALRNDPFWDGALSFDVMEQIVLLHQLPLDDIAVLKAQEWLQLAGLSTVATETTRAAMAMVAHEHEVHPLRDWLDGLAWDGTPRLASWLAQYAGAKDDEYHRQVSTLFLTAMVARVYEPGCKQDYVLVLEGSQRRQKSMLCEALASERYFSDHLPELTNDKDVSDHITGKWVVEIAELSAFQRADNEKLKAFITRKREIYRPAYGHTRIHVPRTCCFIATTNKFQYLKDETGGRRFWPVTCGSLIDVAGIEANRDMLFAEAVHLYRGTHRWWPDGNLEDLLFVPQQAARQEDDIWASAVADWALGKAGDYYMIDIARGLGFITERLGAHDVRRLTAILETLGWTRKPRTTRGTPWQAP